jgi:thermolysin
MIQEELLAGLRARDAQLRVTWDPSATTVTHLSGALGDENGGEPVEIARSFLVRNAALFGMDDVERDLGRSSVKTDSYGWHHVAFQQLVAGVPVWSGATQVHLGKDGVVRSVSTSYKRQAHVDVQPTVDAKEAVRRAADEIGSERARPLREPQLVVYVYEGQPYLAWVLTLRGWAPGLDGTALEPASWLCFVDAHEGKVIARFNQINTHVAPTGQGESVSNPPHLSQTTKTFAVSHTHGPDRYRLQDATRHIDIYDADGDTPDPWTGTVTGSLSEDANDDWDMTTGMTSTDHAQRILCQSAEVDALDHIGRTRDYFKAKFNRNGIDGAGTTIKAYAHARTTDAGGNTIAYNNAYWDGDNEIIVFGDGEYDGILGDFGDLTFFSGALDVVAHEYTHGVTHFEIADATGQPSGFVYSGESGATSEAFSDIFAAFVDGDWRQGDEIVVGSLTATGHMWRDLADPDRGLAYDPSDSISQFLAKGVPQPDHYAIRYQGSADFGGVHINCSIITYACYLAAHGGVSHRAGRTPEDVRVYRKDRLGIGAEHAEQIFYLALTNYFNGKTGVGDNTDATFAEVRQAVLDACDQLRIEGKHGVDQCDWNTLNTAFYAVGLHPVGDDYGPDPMITPWGVWTGSGAPYQTPDVWCEDGSGTHVNAEKAVVNRLVAQLHNIGDQPAGAVIVRFFYAPFGFGYQHSDFRLIGETTVDLAAGQTTTVGVNWDLTDLTDDFGGVWPRPVGDFDHFCVRVEAVRGEANDVSDCNNVAQHNFVNVKTHPGAQPETALIIANPDREREAKVKLRVHTTFPRGWKVLLDGAPVPAGIALSGNEKRTARLSVVVPVQPRVQAPLNGTLVGSLGGRVRGEISGLIGDVLLNPRNLKRPRTLQFRATFRGTLSGRLSARLRAVVDVRVVDRETGAIEGTLRGAAYEADSSRPILVEGPIRGQLTPERRVSLEGHIGGELIGGVDYSLDW